MLNKIELLFIQLIHIYIGKRQSLSITATDEEWTLIYKLACKHSIAGILYVSLEKLPLDQKPSKKISLQWYITKERIIKQNISIVETIINLEEYIKSKGVQSCVLKGAGIAHLYPTPNLRIYGDIDIWIDGDRKQIINEVQKQQPNIHVVYHHISEIKYNNVNIEVHFTPSWLNSPILNYKLQKWFNNQKKIQFNHKIYIDSNKYFITPDTSFNRVYILIHILKHLLYEGITIKQLMDYYYVLRQDINSYEIDEFNLILRELKLDKFASNLMGVMQTIFCVDTKHCIVMPNNNDNPISISDLIHCKTIESNNHNILIRGFINIKKNMKYLKYYPYEIIWMPYFKIINNIIYKK